MQFEASKIKQLLRLHTQALTQSFQCTQRRTPHASFKAADLTERDARSIGQFLLA